MTRAFAVRATLGYGVGAPCWASGLCRFLAGVGGSRVAYLCRAAFPAALLDHEHELIDRPGTRSAG